MESWLITVDSGLGTITESILEQDMLTGADEPVAHCAKHMAFMKARALVEDRLCFYTDGVSDPHALYAQCVLNAVDQFFERLLNIADIHQVSEMILLDPSGCVAVCLDDFL